MARSSRNIPNMHELLLEFCQGICALKEPEEAAEFVKDLLSQNELAILAKRLRIARLLSEGEKFDDIQKQLRVGNATISRVSAWLQTSGEGYRLVIERTRKNPIDDATVLESKNRTSPLRRFMRSRPMYFWPEVLLLDIVEGASQRQRGRLLKTLSILKKSGKKEKLFRDLERALRRNR